MISIENYDSNNMEIVKKTLEAVEKSGKAVFVTYNPKVTEGLKQHIIYHLPKYKDKFLVFEDKDGKFPWIRDLASGWEKQKNGSYRLINRTSYSAHVGPLTNLLSLCTGGEIDLSTKNQNPMFLNDSFDGGNAISDGAGTCMMIDDENQRATAQRLNCKTFITKPRMMTGKEYPHKNHHTDVYASFLAPGVALVSDVDSQCKDQISENVREYYDRYAKAFEDAKIKVVRYPLALGCPQLEDQVRSLKVSERMVGGQRKFFTEIRPLAFPQATDTVALRSYTNLVQTRDAYLVPKFMGPTNEVNLTPDYAVYAPTAPELQIQLDHANNGFADRLQELMDEGVIPKKKIQQIPISNGHITSGGAVRCLSWEIPNDLAQCTQENLEMGLLRLSKKAKDMSLCIEESPTYEHCQLAREMHEIISYPVNEDHHAINPSSSLDLDKLQKADETIKAPETLVNDLKLQVSKLKEAIFKFCGFLDVF